MVNPSVANDRKIELRKKISSMINRINGHHDRDWTSVRKKFQDVTCSTRNKCRDTKREQQKTGGGKSYAGPFTTTALLALDCVYEVSVSGI